MIRALNIALNAAHPELPLPEAVAFESSPTALFVRGVPRRVGKWALTAVYVAMTRPDGSVATRSAVESAGGVWTVTLPGSPAAGRTTAGLRIYADGDDETGAVVTGYVLGFADLEIKPLSAAPTPAPGTDAHEMWYYDEEPATPRKGDVCEIDGALKYYDGEEWQSFATGGGDIAILQQFYLEEKRKIDPRFGVASNVSVIIGVDGNRYEEVTEGAFVPATYGEGVYAKEIYLAPTVDAINGPDDVYYVRYIQKIVCYGNITYIDQFVFLNAYRLNFLSLAGQGQTDAVANGNVDFSMCDNSILVVIPDAYYQDETSAFWNWADYVQDAGGVNYLRMCNFAKASNPRRNPYIVETSYAMSDGTQEKYFIIPDYQWDVKWAKRWGENFAFPEGEEIGSIMLNDICGVADVQFNNRATLSRPSVSMGYVQTFGVDCPLPLGFDSHYGGVTIVAVVSGFNGYTANVNFGGMKIEGRTLQILDPSDNEVSLSANSIGESLTSFVFRANRTGASFQWLLNLGRSIFTTPEEWTEMGDYDFISDGMSIACDNGQAPFSFHALRIYNAFLTDAQIMKLARLDAERFNLTEEY